VSDPGLLGPVELLNSREVELSKVAIDDNDEARKLLIAPKDTVSMVKYGWCLSRRVLSYCQDSYSV